MLRLVEGVGGGGVGGRVAVPLAYIVIWRREKKWTGKKKKRKKKETCFVVMPGRFVGLYEDLLLFLDQQAIRNLPGGSGH